MDTDPKPLFEKPEATLEKVALADIRPWSSGGAKSRSAKSIAVLGLRGVVTLERLALGSRYRYKVVDGSRRLNKARDQGIEFVNAEVLPEDTDQVEAAVLRFMLNLGRSPNPVQEAEAIREVFEAYRAEGVPEAEAPGAIARRFGVSPKIVGQRLRLLTLPPALQAGVTGGKVAAGVAAKVANLPGAQKDELVGELAEKGKLTARDVQRVRQAKQAAILSELPANLFAPPEGPCERARRALASFLNEGVTADELAALIRDLAEKTVF